MSKKRRREQPAVDVETVEIYEDLAHEDEEIRLKAAKALLEKVSDDKRPSHEELEKILRRLFRGLCSSRKAARLGFSVVLTEFLLQHVDRPGTSESGLAHLHVTEAVDVLEKQTHISGSVAGQEERDHHFGRLFGAEALIKSGVLMSSGAQSDQWERVINLVYELANKKSWLREECGWVLQEALEQLKSSSDGSNYAQVIIDKLQSASLSKTPEGLALWVIAQSNFPDIDFPKHIWHNEDPLHRKERSALARILKETSAKDDLRDGGEKPIGTGTWSSKLHFAWEVVLGALLDTNQNHLKRLSFSDLWVEAVDNGLFSMSSSNERKYWGFLLFDKYVQDLSAPTIDVLLGKNFVRCLMNQLAQQDRYLHRMAEKVLRTIHARVSNEPFLASIFIEKLTKNTGFVNFDAATKTRTIDKLLGQADTSVLDQIVLGLNDVILQPRTGDEKSAASARQIVADQLLSIVRSRAYPSSSDIQFTQHRDCISLILNTFVKYGYPSTGQDSSSAKHNPIPPLTEPTKEIFRSRLNSALGHVMTKVPTATSHAYDVLCCIRCQANITDYFQFDADITRIVERGWKTLEKIHSKEKTVAESKKQYHRAFELLFTMTLLQVYNGDADAVSMMDDLDGSYKALVKHKSSGQAEEGSELLIEIVLSFSARTSLVSKRLAEQVFSMCTSLVNESGLGSMLKVLETKESISGQGEIFQQEDETMGDVVSGSDASDVDKVSAGHGDNDSLNGPEEDSEGSGISSASGNEEDSDMLQSADDPELVAFDQKLAQALGTKRADQLLAAGEDDESSDDDMDDEQMEALDVHLEKVFSERKKVTSKKTERKQAKETIMVFKGRVLELLEIFIKQQYRSRLAFAAILPLLALIRTTTSKHISEKAGNLVREYSKLYKLKDSIPAEPLFLLDETIDLLRAVHDAAAKEGSNVYSSACSHASLLLAKVIVANGGDISGVIDCYASTQNRFMTDPTCKVKTSLFTDWMNWCTSARKTLQSDHPHRQATSV